MQTRLRKGAQHRGILFNTVHTVLNHVSILLQKQRLHFRLHYLTDRYILWKHVYFQLAIQSILLRLRQGSKVRGRQQ